MYVRSLEWVLACTACHVLWWFALYLWEMTCQCAPLLVLYFQSIPIKHNFPYANKFEVTDSGSGLWGLQGVEVAPTHRTLNGPARWLTLRFWIWFLIWLLLMLEDHVTLMRKVLHWIDRQTEFLKVIMLVLAHFRHAIHNIASKVIVITVFFQGLNNLFCSRSTKKIKQFS